MSSNYTPQQWADNDATKPVSAARMTVIEDGIRDHTHASTPFGRKSLSSYTLSRTRFTANAGDVDKVIYTCPVGKQAIPLDPTLSNNYEFDLAMNATASLGIVSPVIMGSATGSLNVSMKKNAIDLGDSNGYVNATNQPSTLNSQMLTLFNAGDQLKISPKAGGGNIVQGLVLMLEVDPAESGLQIIDGVASTTPNTVVYTVPTGKTAWFLGNVVTQVRVTAANPPTNNAHGQLISTELGTINLGTQGFGGSGMGVGVWDGSWAPNYRMLAAGDAIQVWQDNTALPIEYSFIVQEA